MSYFYRQEKKSGRETEPACLLSLQVTQKWVFLEKSLENKQNKLLHLPEQIWRSVSTK